MSAAFVVCYAGSHAWGVPATAPITPPQAWIEMGSALPPTAENAAGLYREAEARLKGPTSDDLEFVNRNGEVLELLRRYIRSDGQSLPPLREALRYGQSPVSSPVPTQEHRLLYSLGPHLRDNRGATVASGPSSSYDLVFPIAPVVSAGPPKGNGSSSRRGHSPGETAHAGTRVANRPAASFQATVSRGS